MTKPLQIEFNASLRQHNSFGIEASAQAYLRVESVDDLAAVKSAESLHRLPRLVLGGGSNVLLTGDFPGLVLHMCGKSIEVVGEDDSAMHVRAAAGENWHDFVLWTLANGMGGLENLSLIPGTVGAAPIQNIGAYGVEMKDCFHSLRAYDFASGEILELNRKDCEFAYRDSVFKRELRARVAILDVCFALPKRWQANLHYAELAKELQARNIPTPSARDVSEAVMAIRTRKLPDPAQIGNAGSFFKNPIVPAAQREDLQLQFPQLVSYPQPDGRFKLAAGWLIEQCGWKGRNLGRAGVYQRQALVLVNRGGASGREIAELAAAIQADVRDRFGVTLEPEPVFI